jgi:hypothetical protein
VMAGIVVDASRMHLTKSHWSALLGELSDLAGRQLSELHTSEFYSGNGVWQGVDGETRSAVVRVILNWLTERKHHLVFAAVDKERFNSSVNAGNVHPEVRTIWRFMGFHLILAIQRSLQSQAKNKGHTVFVFDNQHKHEKHFADLVNAPPAWSDSYYRRAKNQERLDQIVDVPYFGDSKQVALIQVADFFAYFLRRYIEVVDNFRQPRYTDEQAKLSEWASNIAERVLQGSAIYPAKGRCACVSMFYDHAPPAARALVLAPAPPRRRLCVGR